MELRLRLRAGEPRDVDWFAAAVAGFGAGALLMVFELLWAASMGDRNIWRASQLVAAITMGGEVASRPPLAHFDILIVGVALFTHYLLGILFGLVLGWVLSLTHRITQLGLTEAIGTVFGFVLYVLNFHVMVSVFPWLAELQGWSTLIAHLVFGFTAAILYWRLARPWVYSRKAA